LEVLIGSAAPTAVPNPHDPRRRAVGHVRPTLPKVPDLRWLKPSRRLTGIH
jgi:uncharacterized NAD-dependent epimerase/dehydratase family protein